MKRIVLAVTLFATPVLAQNNPPAPPPLPPTITIRVATIDRMLAFLQMDGGAMANSLGNDLRQEAMQQIQAFQAKAVADARAAETKPPPVTKP